VDKGSGGGEERRRGKREGMVRTWGRRVEGVRLGGGEEGGNRTAEGGGRMRDG